MLEHQEWRHAVAAQNMNGGAVEISIEERIGDEARRADRLGNLRHHTVIERRRQSAPVGHEERNGGIRRPRHDAVGQARDP
jgi:hypothetical protein